MNTINISLPARLKSFVDEQVLEGGESASTVTADRPYFEALRGRVRGHSAE